MNDNQVNDLVSWINKKCPPKDKQKLETVDVHSIFAIAWVWYCPSCDAYNIVDVGDDTVTCYKCEHRFIIGNKL
ncbi:hypothetical protein LCGC14_0992290 [marine sediment metagenome]|uniref:Uncharacterized protein n=1 Tax=marine sediment metagenome TaxID=412755 RepID=A0A0F9N5J1_9ZZZZ